MNKLFPLLAFSILLLAPMGIQNAFADTFTFSDDATGGDCTLFGSWNDSTNTCTVTDIAVSEGDIFVIDSGVILVVSGGSNPSEGRIFCIACSFTIVNNGKIVLDGSSGASSGQIGNVAGIITVSNFGAIQTNGGSGTNSGTILSVGGTIIIVNNDTIQTNGADGSSSGAIRTTGGVILITNEACGIVELNGSDMPAAGSITDTSGTITFTNHGTLIENPGTGFQSGILKPTATLIEEPQLCQAIGGEIIPIETASLLLAGSQSTYFMIPALFSIVAIGLVLLRRKY